LTILFLDEEELELQEVLELLLDERHLIGLKHFLELEDDEELVDEHFFLCLRFLWLVLDEELVEELVDGYFIQFFLIL
jgi:hypothetical protein